MNKIEKLAILIGINENISTEEIGNGRWIAQDLEDIGMGSSEATAIFDLLENKNNKYTKVDIDF